MRERDDAEQREQRASPVDGDAPHGQQEAVQETNGAQ